MRAAILLIAACAMFSGAEATVNMQWQTIAEGKAKDKWARRGCGAK